MLSQTSCLLSPHDSGMLFKATETTLDEMMRLLTRQILIRIATRNGKSLCSTSGPRASGTKMLCRDPVVGFQR